MARSLWKVTVLERVVKEVSVEEEERSENVKVNKSTQVNTSPNKSTSHQVTFGAAFLHLFFNFIEFWYMYCTEKM